MEVVAKDLLLLTEKLSEPKQTFATHSCVSIVVLKTATHEAHNHRTFGNMIGDRYILPRMI